MAAVQEGQRLAPPLPGLLDDLADAIAVLGEGPLARERLQAVAARLDPTALGATSLADQVLVGQLRVVVLDLLAARGMSLTEARAQLPQLGA
jgi:hypothetical protein